MNITKLLPDYIEVEYHDKVWQQPVDYEHIPFCYRRCHEYGHLFKSCPLNATRASTGKGDEARKEVEASREDEEGFTEVPIRRKPQKGLINPKPSNKVVTQENHNKFGVLQGEEMEA